MAYMSLQAISKTFAGIRAVGEFSLDIERGALVSFLGPSGCGKTTTLRMIAGFEQPDPDGGRIFLDGQEITMIPPNRRDIGMVFQSYALFPNMTVHGNIAFGLKMHRLTRNETERRVAAILDLVRLKEAGSRYPHQLSGGQQQRVALARALAIRPRVLLLDEPLSALDAEVRVALRGEIRRIQSELAITTVYVTHDQEEALSISDLVVVMNRGVIEQIGTPEQIYHKPQTRFVANFIGTANQFNGIVAGANQIAYNGMRFTTPPLAGYAASAKVVVLVRPENMILYDRKPGEETRNLLEGVIETIIFHGAITRLGVEVGGQRVVADITLSGKTRFALNQRVWISFPPEACQVMGRED